MDYLGGALMVAKMFSSSLPTSTVWCMQEKMTRAAAYSSTMKAPWCSSCRGSKHDTAGAHTQLVLSSKNNLKAAAALSCARRK